MDQGKHLPGVPHCGRGDETENHPAARLTAGTQAIRRAASVLRVLAQCGPEGASLAEVARCAALPRSTAHRILRCLVDERLVAAPRDAKRYCIGELAYELSLAPSASALEVARWQPVVTAIARRTRATAYLMRRSGVESVCMIKADGQAVVRFVPVEVGQRRLLGVGAGATALLAALDATQSEQVIAAIAPALRSYPRLTAESLRAAVRLTRRTGFAMSQGTVVADGFGMGVVVPALGGRTPHLALSIAEHASNVTESAIAEWKRVMMELLGEAFRNPL